MAFTKIEPAGLSTSGNYTIENLNVSGVLTATSFIGDISQATGAAAGLGTALSQDQSNPLNKIYYTNTVLSIGSTQTVNPPDSSNVAYTQYAEIAVDEGFDLIVEDGDDLVPDILGLSTETAGLLSGAGGRVRADNFTNKAGTGAPIFPNGVNVTGVATATTFSGNLTGNVTGNLTGDVTGNVTGNLTGTASTATAAATSYGISGSPTLSGITSVSTTNLTVNGNAYPSAGPLSGRNIIINGSMLAAQRGTVTSVTADAFGGPDRYKCFMGSAGTWTLSQAADAPTGTGLYYSYKFQCTSTGTLSSGSYLGHRMLLEGYDSARLNGQSSTISFWVKCNKTGTMTCEPYDASSGGTQSVSKQFTINAADTWEYKSLTFPANPHNYPSNNAAAIVLHWWLSAGSTWKSTESTGEWTNIANGYRAYGCDIDLTDSTDNYFQITGIQLEVGSVATPFEHRSYGDELIRCQRYYQVTRESVSGGPPTNAYSGYVGATYPNNSYSYGTARFCVPMRAIPVVVLYDNTGASGTATQSGNANGIAATANHITIYGFTAVVKSSGVWTDDARYTIYAGYTANAEL